MNALRYSLFGLMLNMAVLISGATVAGIVLALFTHWPRFVIALIPLIVGILVGIAVFIEGLIHRRRTRLRARKESLRPPE